MGAEGQQAPHPHSFFRDGDDKRITKVEVSPKTDSNYFYKIFIKSQVDASAGRDKLIGKVTSGISDLLGECPPPNEKNTSLIRLDVVVLKSTGSAFENFYKDEFTTLIPVNDRIFSTSVDLSYTFTAVPLTTPADEKKLDFHVPEGSEIVGGAWDGDDVADRARKVTLEVFATDESASVQATLYKMAQQIIAENVHVASVTYTLPNKHYIPVSMEYIGIDNTTPANAEVFAPVAAPRRVFFSLGIMIM